MTLGPAWTKLLDEAKQARRGRIAAYSELMPPPYLVMKPSGEIDPMAALDEDDVWRVSEYEQTQELRPGLLRIARQVLEDLASLARGRSHRLSRPLLDGNPAWPAALAERASLLGDAPTLVLPLALSRTQDDKGRVRWTLLGASHGGARGFWRSFLSPVGGDAPDAWSRFARFITWATGLPSMSGVRVLARGADDRFPDEDLPSFTSAFAWDDDEPIERVALLVTFRPFAHLPAAAQRAVLDGKLRLVPDPRSLLFSQHQGYRQLALELPRAMQIPLLHLVPRSDVAHGVRVPQSGWLDEACDAEQRRQSHGHQLQGGLRRTHRWQRLNRDVDDGSDALLDDKITVALFSTDPDDLGLYGKPMARNAQIWSSSYQLILDGPRAGRAEIEAAKLRLGGGGHFGYRMHYPPMQVGERAVFWHLPLVARLGLGGEVECYDGLQGHFTAEKEGAPDVELWPRREERGAARAAAELFTGVASDLGYRRFTTAGNARKLLETRALLEAPLAPSLARALVHTARELSLEGWIDGLDERTAPHPERAELSARLALELRGLLGEEEVDPGAGLTYRRTRGRDFEERYWRTLAELCEGELREKNNADTVTVHQPPASLASDVAAAGISIAARHLDAIGDQLHQRYESLIDQHGLVGRAFSADHSFRWETELALPWSTGWLGSQAAPTERNILLVIPGRDRSQAILAADHYDTAYMEDLYSQGRHRHASAGADDNHSATAALLMAAEVLLPMSRDGKLERDVWLVHLTGEEFPADSLGARALVERLLARDLTVTARSGQVHDLSGVTVRGALVMDMIAHNHQHDRDVLQIAPGAGPGAARLARRAFVASRRWSEGARRWNEEPARRGRPRGERSESGAVVPPIAPHLRLQAEVRPHWDARSALYNTDGQIFSDAGIPVVLLMENYDINRSGYHDAHDTMKNIDLDYGAAVTAIAIETLADAACAPDPI